MISGYLCASPTAPAAAALSDTSIRVTWAWPASCYGVAVERALSATGPWSEVTRRWAIYPFLDPTWDDTALTPGTGYSYRLRTIASDAGWTSSGYTAAVTATTTGSQAPAAPAGLAATVTSATTATLTWTDASTTEAGFAVEFAAAAAGPFGEAFRVGAGTTQVQVTGLAPATAYWFRVRAYRGTALSAPSNVAAFTTATSGLFRVTGDATVVASTGDSSLQARNLVGEYDAVGCFFLWTFDQDNKIYYWHNCYGAALRFDTAALSGKNILSARLALQPCALAPGPVGDARYVVRALTGAWNPATVTFNTLPTLYGAGAWGFPAPTAAGEQLLDVTAIVRNWASGTWTNNGLFVEQSPITDVRTFSWIDPGSTTPKTHDSQDQTTSSCSIERNGGSAAWAPTLVVDYR
jgi:hypothetical protein